MTAQWTIALLMGLAAVAEDMWRRRISNLTTAAGLAAGLVWAVATGGLRGLGMALAGAAAGLVVFLFFYLRGGMGAGDLKLMAAFGALLGPRDVVTAAVLAAIAGALFAGFALLKRPARLAIPYAPAIVAGAWLALVGKG
jgi:prepilin peptidase CpaA